MKTTSTKTTSKVNTEKAQLLKKIINKNNNIQTACMSLCESH
ncbi:hypothetical protein SAMN05661096_03513 [Marivirga sericea]|uniref:Uncharacterized protein n=1 Tax=Marivirga sericea TaxID=1028 RepID=A0A1X7L4D3_9BACT|nr:hypothetical protein SAMN05661096_03513 [Marivirga sericea]